MRYVLIGNDGDLHVKEGSWPQIEAEVGPHGWAPVNLIQITPYEGFRGMVSDVGLLSPEEYPRNIVGGLLLTAFQASFQPYAGPVVITGFRRPPYAEPEEISLTSKQVQTLTDFHTAIRHALGGERPPSSVLSSWAAVVGSWEQWAQLARDAADEMRFMRTPQLREVWRDLR